MYGFFAQQGTDHKLTKCVRRVLSHLEVQIQISQNRKSYPGSMHPWATQKTSGSSRGHQLRKTSWRGRDQGRWQRRSVEKRDSGRSNAVDGEELRKGDDMEEQGRHSAGFLTCGEELSEEADEGNVQNGHAAVKHSDYGASLSLLASKKERAAGSHETTSTSIGNPGVVIENFATVNDQPVDIQTQLSAMSLQNNNSHKQDANSSDARCQDVVPRPSSAPHNKPSSAKSNASHQDQKSSSYKRHRRLQSAPINHHFHNPRYSSAAHKKTCYQPGPHTIDVHNAFSAINGPNASVTSLLGPPPCPRYVSNGILHPSAWYQVPGRYATGGQPFPPKRSQKRVRLKDSQTKSLPDFGLQCGAMSVRSQRPESVPF